LQDDQQDSDVYLVMNVYGEGKRAVCGLAVDVVFAGILGQDLTELRDLRGDC